MTELSNNSAQLRNTGHRPSIDLTSHQARTMDVIRKYLSDHGLPPTISELAELLGITPASTHDQINQLVRKGYLRRLPGKARGLILADETAHKPVELVTIPIVGCVAAGMPILAEENIIGEISVTSEILSGGKLFALVVKGDSMIDAGIKDGDIVIVQMQPVAESGAIVVALLGNDATVKRLHYKDHIIELRPENPRFEPILIEPEDNFRILGKVVATRRHRIGSKG